jgi:PAS domain-containing protein
MKKYRNKTKAVLDRENYDFLKSRLASFEELNPRPIVEFDMNSDIFYVNLAAEKLFKKLGRDKKEYFSNIKNIISFLKKDQEPFIREINIKDKWFRQNFYYIPIFDLVRMFGMDITYEKKREEAMKQSEEQYHLLLEKMSYGYALQDIIYDKNKKPVDYRFVDLNPAFEKLSKLKKEDILGKTANQISQSPKTKKSIKMRKAYDKVALTGKPASFETYNERLKKYFNLYAYKPNKNQMALIFSDITSQKKWMRKKIILYRSCLMS